MKLMYGDCLEIMNQIPDKSVSAVVCDLPYGVLNKNNPNAKWDCVLPLDVLWREWERVCKDNAAIILFAQGMFTAQLMMSNPGMWRYNLIWAKGRSTGFLNSKRMPLRAHEDICVFYKGMPTYNPQMVKAEKGKETHSIGKRWKERTSSCYGAYKHVGDGDLSLKFPNSILEFKRDAPTELVHPTQKPVDLIRWLIRSYTNKGDVVLDSTMGSGTTGIAAVIEERDFIGIEKEEKYFLLAQKRIQETMRTPVQQELL